MTIQERIGFAILLLRRERKISQESLSLSTSIDRRYMSDIENGRRNVSIDIIYRIARFFGLSLRDFFTYTDQLGKALRTSKQVRRWLQDNGYDQTVLLEDPDFSTAIVGITDDERLVYAYDRMVNHLMLQDHITAEEAMEFIDYNTVRALPYMGDKAPVILYDIK